MPRDIIFYSWHVRHVLFYGDIPTLLADRGWNVRCIHHFSADAYPLATAGNVQYQFEVEMPAIEMLDADLYMSACTAQPWFPARAKRVHFMVSINSIEGSYDETHLQPYDAIVCAGHHHVDEIARLGTDSGWQPKQLLPVGYPKLDGQRRLLGELALTPPGDVPTVVFAPTHAYHINWMYSVLRQYGEQLVDRLISDGIRVIFRPHPESWDDQDRPIIDAIVGRFGNHPLFILDQLGNYYQSYGRSDLMITDLSGTGFTFAFAFGRPTIFFAPDAWTEVGKAGIQFDSRHEVGEVVRDLANLVPAVRSMHGRAAEYASGIEKFSTGLLFNPGASEQFFVDLVDSGAL